VCVRVHVSAHGCAAANRCTRRRATTEERQLGAAEVDIDGALHDGDIVLRTEEHGLEWGLPSDGLVASTRVRLAARQGLGRHGGAAENKGNAMVWQR
jgi:hypothetical protein